MCAGPMYCVCNLLSYSWTCFDEHPQGGVLPAASYELNIFYDSAGKRMVSLEVNDFQQEIDNTLTT